MCISTSSEKNAPSRSDNKSGEIVNKKQVSKSMTNQRRGKRVRQSSLPLPCNVTTNVNGNGMNHLRRVKQSQSKLRMKHKDDEPSGGIEAIIPSLVILIVLGWGFAAKMGFCGRATVAGIDLGTTNSVVCVREQAKGTNLGKIECMPDPLTKSPIIPSVVSFMDPHDADNYSPKRKKDKPSTSFQLDPSPSHVVVGSAAKLRINTHPHHTLYHAKRVLGRPCTDNAVQDLSDEVEFHVSCNSTTVLDLAQSDIDNLRISGNGDIVFRVPFHSIDPQTREPIDELLLQPHNIGSYIIHHLMEITRISLKHDSVQNAVIAVPANFDRFQRAATVWAFRNAGVSVARVLEEPVAAALAYGLQKKDGVNYIMVYDFGGGTLDVSVLYVNDDGYVDVMGSDGDNSLGGVDFDVAVSHSLLEADEGNGRRVIKRVRSVLKEMERMLSDSGNEKDIEELISSQCNKVEETPLCTLSSFHTVSEDMKINLSSSLDGEKIVHGSCLGLTKDIIIPKSIPDLCSLLEPIELTLTLDQYNEVCAHLYDRSLVPIRRILKDMNLEREEIDEVVMVGGTTRMPQIRSLVKAELAVESLNIHIDPDLTVAYGAASVMD